MREKNNYPTTNELVTNKKLLMYKKITKIKP